jgi:hypothetical protein
MALTTTKERNSVSGSRITAFFSVLLDNSYPTGGYVFNLANESGLSNIDSVSISQQGFATNIKTFHFLMDPTNVKILCMGDSTEASGAAVLNGPALAAGGFTMIEAANATDLTGITLKIAVTGRR